jgi:hypothetical protein
MIEPSKLLDSTFNQLFNTDGWHTDFKNFKWIQTNGESSNENGFYGPGSDFESISNIIKKK